MSPVKRRVGQRPRRSSRARRLTEVVSGPNEDDAVQSRGGEIAVIGTPSDTRDVCSGVMSSCQGSKRERVPLTRIMADETPDGLPVLDVRLGRSPDFTSSSSAVQRVIGSALRRV